MSAREVFATPRAAEFLERRALQSQTGQPADRFGDVVLKELLDNALDACESAGVVPEIELAVSTKDTVQLVTVADNGPGLPPEVVEGILDFNVLVSDKAAYRSPTRGAQGNAFKTLVGIPHALGVAEAVVIEARGVRHQIAVGVDPGGNVVVRHDRSESLRAAGTAVTIPLPAELMVADWLSKFAAVNPHATLIEQAFPSDGEPTRIYKSTAQDGWRKPQPDEPTSPWWYDQAAMRRLVFAHIGRTRQGARDVPLGEFIRTFDGLTSTVKARSVAAAVPGISRLSDFENVPELVDKLLDAMRAEAKRPNPARLGRVGRDHLHAHLDQEFGVERFWYAHKAVDADGIGWALEVAIAETTRPGSVTYATNYSASFDDPLGRANLSAADVSAWGAASLLRQCDAMPNPGNGYQRAVVVHVMTAAPEFTDKGKVALTVPTMVADVFAEVLASTAKTLRVEHKRAERDAAAAEKAAERGRQRAARESRPVPEQRVTLKDAVFSVMEEAIAEASGNGTLPFPTRNLLYSIRPRIQQFTDAELKKDYFGQTLVVEWERENGPIPGHYRDPRGELREPHTHKTVRLGTREVADYTLPAHVFDKILYIEKEGLNPIFEAAKLAERYDMAIASGKGQPVEAARELFARAGAGNYRLFVLHDADHAGYVIRRAIAEETARMPNHRVEVVDLGLTVAEAVERGLPTERYTRKVELPWWMPDRLTEQETEWFQGRQVGRKQWVCTRVELNALGSRGLIELVEAGLQENRATNKVIPPRAHITTEARAMVRGIVLDVAEDVFRDLGLDIAEITDIIARTYFKPGVVEMGQALVNRRLRGNSPRRWTHAVDEEVRRRLDRSKVDARVRRLIADRLSAAQDGAGDVG